MSRSLQEKQVESESKALSAFARIEIQLSGIERYAMKFLEEETADLAAEQLRIAEVCVCVCVFLCMFVCVHACIYMHVYIEIHYVLL